MVTKDPTSNLAERLTSNFKNPDFVRRYKLAEQLTSLFANPLITESGLATCSPAEPLTILENACGTGAVGSLIQKTLAEQGKKEWKLVSGDFSEAMVECARERAEEEKWVNSEVRIVDAMDMKLESGAFSHVLTGFCFPMLPDNDAAFKECFRILRPGGTYASTNWKTTPQIALVLSSLSSLKDSLPLPESASFQKALNKGWDEESTIISTLESHGFVDVKVTPVTDSVSISITDFVEMNRSFVPGMFGRFWSSEQMEEWMPKVPGVIQAYLEREFGVDGWIKLEPVVMVVSARKPE
ncbi:S-adenosyl-L-methionine-dependent methyltransferase [Aspergillus venezuelensis]